MTLWLYRLLLRAYPREFRERFADELLAACERRMAAARHVGRRRAVRVALGQLADPIVNGIGQRRARRRRTSWDGRPSLMIRRLAYDLRFAGRLAGRQPGFSLVVVLTLALGIGANTAVFSLVDGILLRPMPFREAGQLVFFWTKLEWVGVPQAWMSGGHIALLEREMKTVDEFVAIRSGVTQLTGVGEPAQVRIGLVTANVFDVLGITPALGRGFLPEEDLPDRSKVVVLGYPLWRQQFGADPAAVGKQIQIGGDSHEVVGVAPEGFRFLVPSSLGGPIAADLWAPGGWDLPSMPTSPFSFALMGRVRLGLSPDDARAELDVIGGRLDREVYGNRGFGWALIGMKENLTNEVRPALLVLLGGAALVLLIACANVASLFLVRAVGREREMAVRSALGASRLRTATQLAGECLVLGMAGAACGVALAAGAVAVLKNWLGAGVPRLDSVAVDWRVLGVTLGVTVAVALVAGVWPSLPGRRHRLAAALRDGHRGSAGPRQRRLRAAFVAGELAMAFALLTSALLLVQTFAAMQRVDPGFDAANVVTARVALSQNRFPQGRGAPAFFADVLDRLAATPGVGATGAVDAGPLSGGASQYNAAPLDRTDGASMLVDGIVATPGYFDAIGMTLLRGTGFDAGLRADAPPVAVIDDVVADAFWPGGNPIGSTLRVDVVPDPVTVIGVVRQAHLYDLHLPGRGQVYFPHVQSPDATLTVVARADDPSVVGPALRRIVAELDPALPVANVTTMADVMRDVLAERRSSTALLAGFALVAVALAVVGVHGLVSYAVTQRRRELSVRMALGARPVDIRRLVLGQAAWLTAAGLAAGGVVHALISRLLITQLFGVTAADPPTLGAVAVLLLAAAVVSAGIPAWRASGTSPADALKTD